MAVLADSTIRVWDPAVGIVAMLEVPDVTAVSWSPVGEQIMMAKGNTVYVKDASMHQKEGTYDDLFLSLDAGMVSLLRQCER